MTLIAVAKQVLDSAQSAALESLDQPLGLLSSTLQQDLTSEDLRGAQRLLEDARTALYVRRAHIVRALQQNRRNGFYGQAKSSFSSWEFSA